MQMRGNLHRYRVSSSGKRNRMLQGTFIPSYRAVLKCAAYGLLYTLLWCKKNEQKLVETSQASALNCSHTTAYSVKILPVE